MIAQNHIRYVGHYEADTLVVDTIGITTKAPVDYTSRRIRQIT